jgi:hypothetical protein
MPRNRLLSQIDEELVQARESLKFWRDQTLLLDSTEFQVAAKRQVMHREAEIKRLLEAQEILLAIEPAGSGATASSPSASRSSFR